MIWSQPIECIRTRFTLPDFPFQLTRLSVIKRSAAIIDLRHIDLQNRGLIVSMESMNQASQPSSRLHDVLSSLMAKPPRRRYRG